MTSTSRQPETKAERTRAAILSAAVALFGRGGFRSTSVAEVCREAGVSGSLAYAYFRDKEDLFHAAVDYDAAEVIQTGVGYVLKSEAVDWEPAALVNLLETVEAHPLTARILAGKEPQATAALLDLKALDNLRQVVAERMSLGQEFGIVRPDIDPQVHARAGVHLWIVLLMAAQQFGKERIIAEFPPIQTVLRAASFSDLSQYPVAIPDQDTSTAD